MRRIEGFPRRVGPDHVEVELQDRDAGVPARGTVLLAADVPMQRKAGAHLHQRVVFVVIDGRGAEGRDLVHDVEPIDTSTEEW